MMCGIRQFGRAAAIAFVAMAASIANAQVPGAPPPGMPSGGKIGALNCTLSPTIGLVLGSLQRMECRFAPDGPFPPEIYTGTFGTLGFDVGVTIAQQLA